FCRGMEIILVGAQRDILISPVGSFVGKSGKRIVISVCLVRQWAIPAHMILTSLLITKNVERSSAKTPFAVSLFTGRGALPLELLLSYCACALVDVLEDD